MDSLNKKEKQMTPATTITTTTTTSTSNSNPLNFTNMKKCKQIPTTACCFFCIMEEPDTSLRRAAIVKFFKDMPLKDTEDQVLVLSGLWQIAMTQPDDPELPSLGIFHCMASLIQKGINDTKWLLKDQNVYMPYYAAHIIGSYTMNKVEFAERAVNSNILPQLIELMRGKISWVEQRVAVRALGHLASYERTFESMAAYEELVITLAMELASTCLKEVYTKFVRVNEDKRLKYHCDLMTRGIGGVEMQNRKAEEWGSQLQCWCIYLLNCFACKERGLDLICKEEFLKDLCEMWGGLVNHTSPAGIGLIRILCYSKMGRERISQIKKVIDNLCNLSRSSDDWQYMGIDCLLLLLKDQGTRYKVLDIALPCLVDLVELKKLHDRQNLGEKITKVLLSNHKRMKVTTLNYKTQEAYEELWDLKVHRPKKEKALSQERVEERRVLVGLIKQQGNQMFWLGNVEEAMRKYNEALEICPLKLRKERMVIYSNRGQCNLLLGDYDGAIRDTTRALCLSNPVNSHGKSLWRRSQAHNVKGMARESLMDCVMFVNGCVNKSVKIPYHAARMISKQMEATWLFAGSERMMRSDEEREEQMMTRMMLEKKKGINIMS